LSRPTFWKILRTRDVGEFTPAPYVLTVLNCCFWICYGLPQVKNLMLVISINAAGLAIEFIYVSIYMLFAKGTAKVFVIKLNATQF
jgi:solute carrier family 50 protein (sugar transporter)